MVVPELPERCNSWIVVDNGEAVLETWSRDLVERIASRNMAGVEIYSALAWLQGLNEIA